MLKEILGALTGKSRHSKAGKESLEEEKKKSKYKRGKPKQKKDYAYFRLKGLENKQSEEIEKLMKEFKSNKRSK